MKGNGASVSLVLALVLAVPLLAKGPTTKIIVARPSSSSVFVINDQQALKAFEVWGGRGAVVNGVEQKGGFIIDWSSGPIAKRPSGLATYQVSFYTDADRPVYVVDYGRDPANGRGYVYLPGRDDQRYRLNVRTILRDGLEGDWFRASREWEELVNPLIDGHPSTRASSE
jgi:hypothetical protein